MAKQGYFYVGKLLKTHGIKGELQLGLDVDNPEDLQELKVVFIEINKGLIPYFVENLRIGGQKAIVALRDIPSVEKASWLCGKDVYADEKMLPERDDEGFRPDHLIGFGVTDLHYGYIGTIEHIVELRGHNLMHIDSNGKEVLVPLRDEIIVAIDMKQKTMQIEAPEGLIELYI